jgi:hypothetical protein
MINLGFSLMLLVLTDMSDFYFQKVTRTHLEGHAEILLGTIAGQGWLELLPIQFVTFKEINLPIDSSDQIVWRLAQANHIMKGKSCDGRLSINDYSKPWSLWL